MNPKLKTFLIMTAYVSYAVFTLAASKLSYDWGERNFTQNYVCIISAYSTLITLLLLLYIIHIIIDNKQNKKYIIEKQEKPTENQEKETIRDFVYYTTNTNHRADKQPR